jgi:heme oxygenase
MLSLNVKTHTLSSHQQLEKILIGQMRSIRSKQDYIRLLQLFYTFFGSLEQSINYYISPQNLPDYEKRRKTELLAEDITVLGGKINSLAGTGNIPVITSYLHALGALYVIEGSTLGGKIISKMIAQQLGITDGKGLTFFLGYGDDTEDMWSSFKELLDKTNEEDQEVVIVSANNTFIKFKEWIGIYPGS